MSTEDTDGFAQVASEMNTRIEKHAVAKSDSEQIPKGGPLVLVCWGKDYKPTFPHRPLTTEAGWKEGSSPEAVEVAILLCENPKGQSESTS